MLLNNLRVWWQQSRFPDEIRITGCQPVDLAEILEELAAGLLAVEKPPAPASAKIETPRTEAAPQTSSSPAQDLSFVIGLCNDLSRLQRNAQTIATETKEVRAIRRAIERLVDALKQRGVEYFEKAGGRFDPRDIEFEPKGQPVVVPGLAQSRIGLCECPVVKFNGKIVQRAQGLVEVPAAPEKK